MKALAISIGVIGILRSLYLGLWIMFIQGIVGLVEVIRSNLPSSAIAWSILKIIFAGSVTSIGIFVSAILARFVYPD